MTRNGWFQKRWAVVLVGAAFLIAGASGLGQAQTRPQAKTRSGTLAGVRQGAIDAYKGIPYAAQPVGDLRWRPPQPAPHWQGVRDASHFGPACPQPNLSVFHVHTPSKQAEGCLYLNVWAPAKHQKPLPVMVWLHGGAHRIGSGSQPFYNGTHLAERGVVVVTLNYRLGYLGYFADKALAGQGGGGNYGLMDQIKALHWVRNNIAAFGGDPKQVTIFGESAGGADVLTLMTTPVARDLFARAIVESGGGWGKPPTRQAMQETVAANLKKVGVPAGADAETLRGLSPRKLVKAQAGNRKPGFGPFLDHKTVFKAPYAVFADRRAAKVPLIIGTNSWEGNLLKFRDVGMKGHILSFMVGLLGWYSGEDNSGQTRDERLFRDVGFAAPARWVAAQHSHRAPSWLYRFDYVGSWHRDKVPGAGHGSEVPFVFDTLDTFSDLKGETTVEDKRIAKGMADCWTAFAKTGRPDCGMARWQPYDAGADNLLIVNQKPHMAKNPEHEVLDKIRNWFGPDSLLGG